MVGFLFIWVSPEWSSCLIIRARTPRMMMTMITAGIETMNIVIGIEMMNAAIGIETMDVVIGTEMMIE